MCSGNPKSAIGVASIVGISIFVILIVAIICVVIISVDCKHVCRSRWEKVRPYVWRRIIRSEAEQERKNMADAKKEQGRWRNRLWWRTNLQVAVDDRIEGNDGIKQPTELRPILKNKNTSLIERIDLVSEDKNES